MKTGIFLMLVMMLPVLACGQQFQKKISIKLPPGTQPAQIMWVDVDNDSLLDIVVSDSSGSLFSVSAWSGLMSDSIKKHSLLAAPLAGGIFAATDLNQDNKMDFILSGRSGGTQAFLNEGGFSFQKGNSPGSFGASKINFTDFNNDGQKDLLILRDSSTLMLLQNKNQSFKTIVNSTSLNIKDFSVFDFDNNGFPDIALSGKDKSNQPFLTIVEFKNYFDTLRIVNIPVSNSGILASGDLNHDGFFDLIVSGPGPTGAWINQAYLANDTVFAPGNQYPGTRPTHVEIADFTSDGKADVSFFGKDLTGNPAHWIVEFSGDTVSIPSTHVLKQVFGDYDRDGDLDLLQLNDTLGLILLENKEVTKNTGPLVVQNLGAAIIYSHLFAFWDQSSDDHTPSPAITYDLSVTSALTLFGDGEFDASHQTRLTVTNGNQGTNNYALMKAPPGVGSIRVQSIDNSYFTTSPTSQTGTGSGVVINCGITYQNLSDCNPAAAPLTITAGSSASWFSFSDGFIGKHTAITIKHPATDTVFSYVPSSSNGCPEITVYNIKTSARDTLHQTLHFTTCTADSITLSVAKEWQLISWTSAGLGLGSDNPFLYFPKASGTVVGLAKNSYGCFLEQNNIIAISVPVLKLSGTEYDIYTGQSVQLGASGGSTYLWTPSNGLDNPSSPDPLAAPVASTTYTVTLTDSAGCHASGTVQVNTIESAFIPSLFSPNGDNKNDALLIFGLNSAQAFHFAIYNREGATVYETSDVALASASGWDGKYNGSLQPTGLYYWKVEGNAANGQPLHLNGKKQGSVMLIH